MPFVALDGRRALNQQRTCSSFEFFQSDRELPIHSASFKNSWSNPGSGTMTLIGEHRTKNGNELRTSPGYDEYKCLMVGTLPV